MLLRAGAPAPRQSTPTTCGSACLVMARALQDPAFAAWLATGRGDRFGPAGTTEQDRFAGYESLVKQRTVSVRGSEGMQVPWFGFWGTPPWGALAELRSLTSVPYHLTWLRGRPAALADVDARVAPGRPALLYVGSATLPRHVCLVAATDDGTVVYEPSAGVVIAFDAAALASGAQPLGGWPVPWFALTPA